MPPYRPAKSPLPDRSIFPKPLLAVGDRSGRSCEMIVASATDRRFVELAGVMLASLFDKGETGDWPVIVFGYRLRARDKAKLRESCGKSSATLRFIDINSHAMLKALPATLYSFNPSPFLRLLMPALLPDQRGRLLYLDADTIVCGSLLPLSEVDLTGFAVAAAEDDSSPARRDGRFPFSLETPYFNSGVMLIDLEAWRRDNLTARGLEFARKNARSLLYADQDALNGALAGRFMPLPPRWNVTRPTAEAGVPDAKIVHFTGTKPWSAACKHPDRELYLHYRALTPWRNKRLATRLETRVARSIRKRRAVLQRLFSRFRESYSPATPTPRAQP